MEDEPVDEYDDDFDEDGAVAMKANDALAARIELAQNEREMAERKHLRTLRPQKVRSHSRAPPKKNKNRTSFPLSILLHHPSPKTNVGNDDDDDDG